MLLLLCAVPLTASAPHGSVLPLSYEQGRPVVPVKVNGAVLRFLLDTGLAESIIRRDAARALKLKEAASPPAIRGSTEVGGPRRATADLALGSATTGAMRLIMISGPLGGADPPQGMIGNDILSRFAWRIDGPERTLWIGRTLPKSGWTACASNALGTKRPPHIANHAFVTLRLTGGAGRAASLAGVLDSATPFSFMNWQAARAIGFEPGPADGGARAPRRIVRVQRLQIGGRELRSVEVRIADFPAFEAMGMHRRPAMFVGMNVLRQIAVGAEAGMDRICFG